MSLSLSYGELVVLDGVTLDLVPGELLVLTGGDGCGTTSLLRLLPGRLLEAPPGSEWSDDDVVPALPGLEHLLGRELWTLSGGERQRVRVASLPVDDVLLVDDGLGTLDSAGAAWVLDLLRARATAGASVVLVAKGDPRAAAAADRVLVLEAGRLLSS